MNRAAPDAVGLGGSSGAARAIARGLEAFAGVAALGLAVGLAEFAASGGAYHWWTWIKVGALYLVSFFGVSARVGVGDGTLFDLHLPLMVGTALAGWLLFRAGRWVRGGSIARPWGPGVCVALAFAIPVSMLGLLARLRFPDIGGPGVDATLRAIAWQVVVFPLAFAAAAVTVGTWWGRPTSSESDSAARGAVVGGWRMWWLALVFAFAGLLLLGVVRSDRTARYAGWLGSQGTGGALFLGHQILAVPNESIFVLAPAMGGSTNVGGSEVGAPSTPVTMSKIGAIGFVVPGIERAVPERDLGGLFYLFILVPAAATVLGGRSAGRGLAGLGKRCLAGAGSGVVFGVLVTVGSLFSSLQVPISRGDGPLRIGAAMPSATLLALAWGVAGGLIGALSSRQSPEAAGPGPGAAPPLSPTSA